MHIYWWERQEESDRQREETPIQGLDQVVAVISVICWHQSGMVETGLPWVMALLAMPHYEQLLGSSSGQFGAHGCPSRAGITIPLLLSHRASVPWTWEGLCVCLRWEPTHWDVVIRSCWTVSCLFLHFNICFCHEKENFYHNEQTQQKASYSFS